MVALPSPPETASRASPVALLTTEIFASRTTAPFWSVTTTTIAAVLGDCARPACAVSSVVRSRAKTDAVARRTTILKSDILNLPAGVFRNCGGRRLLRSGRGSQIIEQVSNYYQPSY